MTDEYFRPGQGLHRKFTLISAPAGFGKTTLLSEWVAGCERPVAWLSLDEGDNDLSRFLTYVIVALQQIDANLGQTAGVALQAPQPPAIEPLITALINEIAALDTSLVFVLDDYHLTSARAIHDGIAFLLEHQPQQLCLVLATRADPPLSLARLRGRGQLTEVRSDDLRFTSGEAATFLNETMYLNLAPEDVEALESRTDRSITNLLESSPLLW